MKINELDATGLIAAYRTGNASPVEAMKYFVNHAAEYEPHLAALFLLESLHPPARRLVRVFGFKPSNGRVPIDPLYMGRVAGPITRTVADAALAMRILARPDNRDHMPPRFSRQTGRLRRAICGACVSGF